MRRRDRHKDLLEAEPYDLVVLDEAHHARTRRENNSSGGERLRPNTLMQLMQQLRQRTNGLLLLTATPMQVSELEVWDLLALLGMPPEWTEDAFERFFEWVEKENPDEATLSYLAGLWRSSVTAFGEAPGNAMPEALRKSPLRKRKALRALNDTDSLSRRNLSIEIRQASLALAKRWTPVQGLISRHSRYLLRAYKQQGSMDLAIGTRHVDDRFLESTPQERALYDAVEDFISTQYAQATGQKKSAVGFVMTIYRRRLASSNSWRKTPPPAKTTTSPASSPLIWRGSKAPSRRFPSKTSSLALTCCWIRPALWWAMTAKGPSSSRPSMSYTPRATSR